MAETIKKINKSVERVELSQHEVDKMSLHKDFALHGSEVRLS